jgi:hypothetical protein
MNLVESGRAALQRDHATAPDLGRRAADPEPQAVPVTAAAATTALKATVAAAAAGLGRTAAVPALEREKC